MRAASSLHPSMLAAPSIIHTLQRTHGFQTYYQSRDYFLKPDAPATATAHQNTPLVYADISTSAPWSALLQSHQVLCDGSVILRRSNQSIPLSTSDHAAQRWGVLSPLWPSLVCLQPLFHSWICFCRNFSWMQHKGAHACKTKTIPYHLHNLIWPLTWSSHCYIICCLHSLGSPVFSLSAFYRMQFCCSAPNKCTEDVINTGYFAFDQERINFMWNNMKEIHHIPYFFSVL